MFETDNFSNVFEKFGLRVSEAGFNTGGVTPFKAFPPVKARNRRLNDAFFYVMMTSNSR